MVKPSFDVVNIEDRIEYQGQPLSEAFSLSEPTAFGLAIAWALLTHNELQEGCIDKNVEKAGLRSA